MDVSIHYPVSDRRSVQIDHSDVDPWYTRIYWAAVLLIFGIVCMMVCGVSVLIWVDQRVPQGTQDTAYAISTIAWVLCLIGFGSAFIADNLQERIAL